MELIQPEMTPTPDVPSADTDTAPDTAAAVSAPPTEPALTVKFNKQQVTLSHEDATRYAQKGMKYEAVEPLFATLRTLAEQHGMSVAAYVEGLASPPAVSTPAPAVSTPAPAVSTPAVGAPAAGAPAVGTTPSLAGDGVTAPDAMEQTADRLAEEYLVLRREVPSVGGFDTLPPDVLREAARSGISLFDAYLRHQHREQCRITAARESAAAAAAHSLGSQAAGGAPDQSSTLRAMLKGVWG